MNDAHNPYPVRFLRRYFSTPSFSLWVIAFLLAVGAWLIWEALTARNANYAVLGMFSESLHRSFYRSNGFYRNLGMLLVVIGGSIALARAARVCDEIGQSDAAAEKQTDDAGHLAHSPRDEVPLDRLQQEARRLEWTGEGLVSPFLACFLVAAWSLDLLGSLAGVPVITGTVFAAAGAEPTGGTIVLVVAVQLAALVATAYCVYLSHWRVWLADALTRGGAEGISAEHGEGLTTRLRTIATGLLGTVGKLWQKAREDRASMSGFVAGIAVCLAAVLLVAWPNGYLAPYLKLSWATGTFWWFRAAELFLLAVAVLWVLLLPGGRTHTDIVVYIGAPKDPTKAFHPLNDFLKFRGRRVVGRLLRDELPRVVVLEQSKEGKHVLHAVTDPTADLLLNSRPYSVVNLSALTNLLHPDGGERVTFPLQDARGFFRPTAELSAQPSPPLPEQCASCAPLSSEGRRGLEKLLLSGTIVADLRRAAQAAFDRFVERAIAPLEEQRALGSGVGKRGLEQIELEFASLLKRVDHEARAVVAVGFSGFEEAFEELAQRKAIVKKLNDLRTEAQGQFDHVISINELRVDSAVNLDREFGQLLRELYSGGDEAAATVLAWAGLSVRVCLDPIYRAAGGEDSMVERLNRRLGEAQARAEAEFEKARDLVYKLLVARTAAQDERRSALLKGLVGAAPHMVPLLSRQPGGLASFIDFLSKQVGAGGDANATRYQELCEAYLAQNGDRPGERRW